VRSSRRQLRAGQGVRARASGADRPGLHAPAAPRRRRFRAIGPAKSTFAGFTRVHPGGPAEAPLAGPAENHKPARKLRALSSSRQGPGRRLKKGVKIHPPPLTTFPGPRRGSRLPDPAAPARLQPSSSSGTAWCQSAAQSGGSGLLRPCWPQAPPGHSQPAGKGEPGETGMGESHIVFE
jgi:hypothetical protein